MTYTDVTCFKARFRSRGETRHHAAPKVSSSARTATLLAALFYSRYIFY